MPTSFFALERASSSEVTGNACDDSEEYRFTVETSSMKEDVFPFSPSIVSSFFLINDGGEPNSGPDRKQERRHSIRTRQNLAIYIQHNVR